MQETVKNINEIDRKNIITNTVWVRWIFVIMLIPFIIFLSFVIFDSPDKNKIAVNAVFHVIFIVVYNTAHIAIIKKLKEKKPLNKFLKSLRPFLDYLVFDNIAIAWAIYYSGGIKSPIIYIYFISVIFTAAAYSKKVIFSIGAFSFFLYNTLYWLEYAGIVSPLKFFPNQSEIYDNFATIFFINFSVNIALLVAVFLSTLISKTISRKETALMDERDKFQLLIENLKDGLIVLDSKNYIMFINNGASEILGIKKEMVVNKQVNISMFEDPKFQNLGRMILIKEETKKKEEFIPVEIKIQNPSPAVIQVYSVNVYNKKGLVATMKILHDVSREKEIEKTKSEFISIAAHQLRTPLSAIKWVFSMILAGDAGKITQAQKELMEKGKVATQTMITLVNDLLDVSRIEEGRFGYNFKQVSLEETLKKIIGMEENRIKEKKIKFTFENPEGRLPLIKADTEKLSLAFQNLIENAINYTLKGGLIKISLKYDKTNLIIEIKDSGVGIPKYQLDKLFTKFFRGSNVIKLQTEGSGLGLFITKNIIEKHKGKIEIKSEEGRGTEITVYLPRMEEIMPEEEFGQFVKKLSLEEKSAKEFSKFIEKF